MNLERCRRRHSRLGGHIVRGHVDGTGTRPRTLAALGGRADRAADRAVPPGGEKGSITVDGVADGVRGRRGLVQECR